MSPAISAGVGAGRGWRPAVRCWRRWPRSSRARGRAPDRARAVGDGAADGLADPPRGVHREFETLRWSKFSTARISPRLPSWIRSSRAARSLVPAGDRHHQAQVGLDEPAAGLARSASTPRARRDAARWAPPARARRGGGPAARASPTPLAGGRRADGHRSRRGIDAGAHHRRETYTHRGTVTNRYPPPWTLG